MNIQDLIILWTREESEEIVGRALTDEEWLDLHEKIVSDDNMWSVINDCVKNTIFDRFPE